MDESEIRKKKMHMQQQENCMRQTRVLFELLYFPQNCTLIHAVILIKLTFTKSQRSIPFYLKICPVQFQVSLCNFKWTL